MFTIIGDIVCIAIGFAGCAVLAHYRPSIFAKIETVTGTAVDTAGDAVSKAEDAVKSATSK